MDDADTPPPLGTLGPTFVGVDERRWEQLRISTDADSVDVVLRRDGRLVVVRANVDAPEVELVPEVETHVVLDGEVVDLRDPTGTAGPAGASSDEALADLVAGVLLATGECRPADRPRVLVVDDPVQARRALAVVQALCWERAAQTGGPHP